MADIMLMGKNPNYMGSWDLDEQPNRQITLTISHIKDEEVAVNGQKEVCTACYWAEGTHKPMILNVTNKKRLCKLYKTKDTDKLKGKAVTITTERVKAFGDIYDALRIVPKIPQVKKAVLPKCEQCGKDIQPAYNMTADQMAAYTKTKYGKAMCGECAKAAAEGAKQ